MALNGMPSEQDTFAFFLAKELGKTVGELDVMSHAEYVRWQAYYEAKGASENMRGVGI